MNSEVELKVTTHARIFVKRIRRWTRRPTVTLFVERSTGADCVTLREGDSLTIDATAKVNKA